MPPSLLPLFFIAVVIFYLGMWTEDFVMNTAIFDAYLDELLFNKAHKGDWAA